MTDSTENTAVNTVMDDLRREAQDLGIQVKSNMTEDTLRKKIEAFYAEKELAAREEAKREAASAADVEPTYEDGVAAFARNKAKARMALRAYARTAEAEARKTKVVTIIDNDQRQNNHTTSCTVNCSNEYFDLGTVVLPLNKPVEVRIGHINALRSVNIPQHVADQDRPGMSRTVMRPRYTIQVEDIIPE